MALNICALRYKKLLEEMEKEKESAERNHNDNEIKRGRPKKDKGGLT